MIAGPTMQLLGAIAGRVVEPAIDRMTARAACNVKVRIAASVKARVSVIARAGRR